MRFLTAQSLSRDGSRVRSARDGGDEDTGKWTVPRPKVRASVFATVVQNGASRTFSAVSMLEWKVLRPLEAGAWRILCTQSVLPARYHTAHGTEEKGCPHTSQPAILNVCEESPMHR